MLKWFPIAWPDRMLRLQVAAQYAALAQSKELLADIAMRNFLFEGAPDNANLAIIEGRRRAALEIFQMARMRPQDVADIGVKINRGGNDAD